MFEVSGQNIAANFNKKSLAKKIFFVKANFSYCKICI